MKPRWILLSASLLFALIVVRPAASQSAQSVDCVDAGEALTRDCAFQFASRFAPVLAVRSAGCNWDQTHQRLGGGYFFTAQRVDSIVRIAYLPAYFRDCGWQGVKCWLPAVDCAPHVGDSEFIVIDLIGDSASTWRVAAIFLSAHCFGRHDSKCRWYRGADLDRFTWHDATVEVWVAEGRHANYPSRKACDKGIYSIDTCDRHDARYRFPIAQDRNIGTRDRPARVAGCYSGGDIASTWVDREAVECFWRPGPFRGWRTNVPGVTGYDRYLGEIAGF